MRNLLTMISPEATSERPNRYAAEMLLARSYVCRHEGCGKAFARNDHLQRHALNHSSSEQRCQRCDATFKRPDLLSMIYPTLSSLCFKTKCFPRKGRHLKRHEMRDNQMGGIGCGVLDTKRRYCRNDTAMPPATLPLQPTTANTDLIHYPARLSHAPQHVPSNSTPTPISLPHIDLAIIPQDCPSASVQHPGTDMPEPCGGASILGMSLDHLYGDMTMSGPLSSSDFPFSLESLERASSSVTAGLDMVANDGPPRGFLGSGDLVSIIAHEQDLYADTEPMMMDTSRDWPCQLSELSSASISASLSSSSDQAMTCGPSAVTENSTTATRMLPAVQRDSPGFTEPGDDEHGPGSEDHRGEAQTRERDEDQGVTGPDSRQSPIHFSTTSVPALTEALRQRFFEVISDTRLTHMDGDVPYTDHPHLSLTALQSYADLFFRRFNHCYNLIHSPTFNPVQADIFLLISIWLIGASYSSKDAHQTATCVWDALVPHVIQQSTSDSRPSLSILQALLLFDSFGTFRAAQKQHERTRLFHSSITNVSSPFKRHRQNETLIIMHCSSYIKA